MKYICYDSNGEIIRWGEENSLPEYIDLTSMESDVTGKTHWVQDGIPVAYTQGQLAARQSRPSYLATWSNQEMGWVYQQTLDQLKELKWANIKNARETAEFAGFSWDGSIFDSDAISQSRIQGAVILAMQALSAGVPFEIDWTLADNTVRTLDAMDMVSVGQALATHVGTQHAIARLLRIDIQAASTKEVVDGISWGN